MICRCRLLSSLFGLSAAVLAIATPSFAAAASPGNERLAPGGQLRPNTERVLVGGTAPPCRRGDRLSITVRLSQGRRTARGERAQRCSGNAKRWLAVLDPVDGRPLRQGNAHAHAVATTMRGGKTLVTRRWHRRLELYPRRVRVGDYGESGTVTIEGIPGFEVSIVGGGAGWRSNCTRDETNTSFVMQQATERVEFGFVAKTDGWCAVETSWSNFEVTVRGNGMEGSGRMWLGQVAPGLGGTFHADCYSGDRVDVNLRRFYVWSGLRCRDLDTFELTVSG